MSDTYRKPLSLCGFCSTADATFLQPPSGLFDAEVVRFNRNTDTLKLKVVAGTIDHIIVYAVDPVHTDDVDSITKGLVTYRYLEVPLSLYERAHGTTLV